MQRFCLPGEEIVRRGCFHFWDGDDAYRNNKIKTTENGDVRTAWVCKGDVFEDDLSLEDSGFLFLVVKHIDQTFAIEDF